MRVVRLKIQHSFHMSTIVLKAWSFEWMFKFVPNLIFFSRRQNTKQNAERFNTILQQYIPQKLECAQLLCPVSAHSSPIACPRYVPLSGSSSQQISLPNIRRIDLSYFTLRMLNFHVCSLQHLLARIPEHISYFYIKRWGRSPWPSWQCLSRPKGPVSLL